MLDTLFSDRQRRVVAATLTLVSLVVMVSLVIWLGWQLLSFFTYFSGVFLPLAVAAILATLMRPFYQAILSRVKNRAVTLITVILSLILPLVALGYYFGVMILDQLSGFFVELPVWSENIQLWLQEKMPALKDWLAGHDLKERMMGLVQGRGNLIAGSAAALGQGVARIFSSAVGWVVLPIYFAYLIQAPTLSSRQLESFLPFLCAETRTHVVYLVTEFVNILVAFFRGQLVVALCQGVLFAVGFSLAGLPHGAILGLLLGLLNIIPYLGNIVGLAVVLPLAWFHPDGGMTVLAGVIVVFVLVQCIEGYILTPRIMGKTTGLHPMAIIFAILFWGTAFSGLLGMILAIPLTAFLVVFWRLLKAKYIKEWL